MSIYPISRVFQTIAKYLDPKTDPIENTMQLVKSTFVDVDLAPVTISHISQDISRRPQDVFWGLGVNWWKQHIDGRHHKWGPNVYDKGLHDCEKEPGYLASSFAACKMA